MSAADKLHNARSMESDFDKIGVDLWKRFNGTREQILWNYDQLIAIYSAAVQDSRRTTIVELLSETVERLKAKSGSSAPAGDALARTGLLHPR